jgi:5-methylcytosine-specific restriction endonuclease McrA
MKGTEVAKIKRFGRRFGQEIRDAVMIKHRFRCSTPGCTNWAYLEMDHVHPYGKDGPTDYGNCDPKCKPCHKLKTEQDRLFWDDTG